MSNSQPPNPSTRQPQQNTMQNPLKRQLPFSSMKPPFLAPGDYHRFNTEPRRVVDHEVETIIVKPPIGQECQLSKAVQEMLNALFREKQKLGSSSFPHYW